MMELPDSVVLIVGGGGGIGLGIAKALAAEDAQVILAGVHEQSLRKAADSPDVARPFRTRVCDVTQRSDVEDLIAWTTAEVGPIDVFVYCAGINVSNRMFSNVDPADFDRVMAVNTTGAFNCFHAVLPRMRERKSGLIINVVSLAGLRNMLLAGLPYCVSKFAQGAIGTFANLEALPDGVRVTNIYPGETNTPILDQRPEPPPPEKRAQMLQPEDIAAMVVAVAKLPARATVPELVITPPHMPFA